MIAVIGLLGGAVIGAVTGFAAGLLLDVALLETLGVSSLVLLSVGYLAGRYRESFEIDSAFAPARRHRGLALLASAGFTALQLTLDVDSGRQRLVVRETRSSRAPCVPPHLSRLSADPPRPAARAGPGRGAAARDGSSATARGTRRARRGACGGRPSREARA